MKYFSLKGKTMHKTKANKDKYYADSASLIRRDSITSPLNYELTTMPTIES